MRKLFKFISDETPHINNNEESIKATLFSMNSHSLQSTL